MESQVSTRLIQFVDAVAVCFINGIVHLACLSMRITVECPQAVSRMDCSIALYVFLRLKPSYWNLCRSFALLPVDFVENAEFALRIRIQCV
jgi:hypothetical protein